MTIKEITSQAFELYATNSPLASYMQTSNYARFMTTEKYNYEYIGLVDETNTINAAGLILTKKIGFNSKYGYSPKGLLVNYYDTSLVEEFVEKLIEYYNKKGYAFIKINPEIVVGSIDPKTHEFKETPNMQIKNDFPSMGFTKLKDNLYFESMTPRFNAYIDLKNSDARNYSKATRNKINNSSWKGLYLDKGTIDDMQDFYNILDTNKPITYYKNLYNSFKDKIDLMLVKVDYSRFIENVQNKYDDEERENVLYNEILHRSKKKADLNRKMDSDARLLNLKNQLIIATNGLNTRNNQVVAGALVIKDGLRVHMVASGFDRNCKFNQNYFLHQALIDYYKPDYAYLDIGGISGDFNKDGPYYGLNRFKMGFNPKIYEYIGEYDLVVNPNKYNYLLSTGKLAEELNKHDELSKK